MKTKIAVRALAAFLMAYAIAGCDRQPADTAVSASEPPAKDTPIAQAAAPGATALELQTVDEKVGTTAAGTKGGGAITATGSSGVLMYGPYVPLGAGRYSLLISGSGKTPFIVDIVTDAGAKTVAKADFTSAENADGSLAKLDFELAEATAAVEFRITVPEGSDIKVVSYKVVTR